MVLNTYDNSEFDLNGACKEKPTVLIFYRGGWCPYCDTHLCELQSIESELVQLGFQIIAVSPDRSDLLQKPVDKHGLKYQILSDSEMSAAKSFSIVFRVGDATVDKYKKSYGIDLEADSGYKHHLLPVPSVFVVGTDGMIQFSYINPK